ncbi:hypothetical protein PAL_GLEAN10024127 [Pteropus alecto]|uniref:Uncharacterized protein n=1 Tax=Pteropus alecto TaxID=9402 RepID=L5JXF3_PTEAL|nr:hypothetical protein PAL_GLEAN10024127 [Pteropus alecto]
MMWLGLPDPCLPRTSRLQDPDLPGYPDGIRGKPEALQYLEPLPPPPRWHRVLEHLPLRRACGQSIKAERPDPDIEQGPGSRRAK